MFDTSRIYPTIHGVECGILNQSGETLMLRSLENDYIILNGEEQILTEVQTNDPTRSYRAHFWFWHAGTVKLHYFAFLLNGMAECAATLVDDKLHVSLSEPEISNYSAKISSTEYSRIIGGAALYLETLDFSSPDDRIGESRLTITPFIGKTQRRKYEFRF